MPARPIDTLLKKNYELIYFKRNFMRKISMAANEGLDERDIKLLIETWRAKAYAMGEKGIERWQEVEKTLPERLKESKQVREAKRIGGIDV